MHMGAYPGVIGTKIMRGRERRIIGVERFMDRSEIKPEIAIPQLWHGVMPRLEEIADCVRPFSTLGLYQYEPPFRPGQNFRYLAGVEVASDSEAPVPEGMTERTVPGDDCLVVTYRGKAEGFGQVWDYFHGYWFPQQSDYDAIDEYELERHDDRFLGTDNECSEFELHFPIKKRMIDNRLTDKTLVDEKGGHVLQDLRHTKNKMVSFQGSEFFGVDMRDTRLTHVNFVHSKWEHIYFSNVHIKEIQMGGTVIENIRRPDAKKSRLDGEPGTDGWVNVEPVTFRSSDLRTAKFENCDMRDVNLQGCQLEGMRIDGIPVIELLDVYRKKTMPH